MMAGAISAETVRLSPELDSCPKARHMVAQFVEQCGLQHLTDVAALCVSELVTNAILHSREPFVLTVRAAGDGLRVDVLDTSPHHVPIATPQVGSAVDLTCWGTGGRGMQIVANLAYRWGYFTTEDAKTVWAEVRNDPPHDALAPIVALCEEVPVAGPLVELAFLHMPVRAAVASGIQTEEVIREIQLDQGAGGGLSPAQVEALFSLLDRSAGPRLAGRHAALRAAAEGRDRFDFESRATEDAMHAMNGVGHALAALAAGQQLPIPELTEDVRAFREWLAEETARQLAGLAPMECPLP
jgi:anti-sigma regulatory factor (Ser/Thr protein kinase)